MGAAVFELLADGAGSLNRARGLQADDLDEVRDAAQVVYLIGLARQPLDGDGNG